MTVIGLHLQVPAEVVCWQGVCLHCQARYAVLHENRSDAPRLNTCPFCGHRAVYAHTELNRDRD